MNTTSNQYVESRVELHGILAEFREALEHEIDKIKKSGQSSTLLYAGRRIESNGSEFWYRFNVEYVPALPADTPCKLLIGNDQIDVTVISFEENAIIISSKNSLPDTIGKARLENGATVLMERLIKRIEGNAERENPAGNTMLQPEGMDQAAQKIFSYDDITLSVNNTDSQNNAIVAALTNDITYIWGPPGTGKTTVIGQIVDELYKHGRSVLVVSHTNTAVDGAIEKTDKTLAKAHGTDDKNYPILRIGHPARPLPPRVLLDAHVEALGKELYQKKESLEIQQSEIHQRVNFINPLLEKNAWVKKTVLPIIADGIWEISRIEKHADKMREQRDELIRDVDKEKVTHPEYGKYPSFFKSFNEKKRAFETLSLQLVNTEKSVHETPGRIQSANDEIKKHDKYHELLGKESQCMSEEFLRGELSKNAGRKTAFGAEIQSLTSERETVQQTIEGYDKKSSVAKFFFSKATVTQAQNRLTEINTRLLQANEEFQRQLRLEQNYQIQLEDLLYLQEQIKSVIPSQTKDYWINQVEKLVQQLATAEKDFQEIRAKKEKLSAELYVLGKSINEAKAAFDTVRELEEKLQIIQSNLQCMGTEVSKKNFECSEHIERERSLCAAFYYSPKEDTNKAIFDELSLLLIDVKTVLASLDISALESEKEQLESHLIEIYRQLNEIKQKIQELEKQAIMGAQIVGATLSKSYLSDTLCERTFDTVILDEASMASIPALWCASYLAEKNVVIVGDFLQLPPIVMANTPMAQKWLGKDIFFHSGMQDRIKRDCPENFIMLNDQFRMESEIADIANMYYGEYVGLKSDDYAKDISKKREEFYSWYSGKRTKHSIHLIDTESLHAWVTGVPQGKSHSRLNCFSAAVDVDLAFKFLENKLAALDPKTAEPVQEASVLIVAPYKPHVTRINQLIELEYINRGFKENLNYIRAGTIHSFQGSEADIVIFDLVIDEPHWKANLFMTDKEVNDDLRRMFNVAVTRAKFKLYIVGNFSYCQKHAKNNALAQLLDKLIKKNRLVKVDAKELLPNIAFSLRRDFVSSNALTSQHIVCREESFNDYFMADIQSFRKRLIIYSPFLTENRLSSLLPDFVDAISNGKQIVVVTKALSDRGKSEIAQYKKCEKQLINIGVSIIHKKGMHEKLIFIDDEAVWIGSLNALSFTGLTGEVMQRHMGKALTAEYEKLFDIEHICEAVEKTYQQKCPICGDEMIVKEGDSGGIYWECTNKDYSRSAEQQYPTDGILRCKCGATYIFSMKNQPRWICSENSAHYQLMRESDLKLEKMAALIPLKSERKEVERYFVEKRKEWEDAKEPSGTGKKVGHKKPTGSKSTDAKKPSKANTLDQMKMF